MSLREPIGWRLEKIIKATPETIEEEKFILKCAKTLQEYKSLEALPNNADVDKRTDKLLNKISSLQNSEMGYTIWKRESHKEFEEKQKKEQEERSQKLAHKVYELYEQGRILDRNPSQKCVTCRYYNKERRNENGQARCSKYPFWVKDDGLCSGFEPIEKPKAEPIEEPKVKPKANESKIKVTIKHSIIFVVCFFAACLICTVTGELTWGWEWDCYALECFLGLFLTLIPAIIGVISLIKILKILISNIISLYKTSIRYKERCYKKIDRLHSYLERGSITQEEFDELKQSILDAMEK